MGLSKIALFMVAVIWIRKKGLSRKSILMVFILLSVQEKKDGADHGLAEAYIDAIMSLLRKLRDGQMANIIKASELVAEAISSGRWVHVFGTGHSHMIADEVSGRAGGLAVFNGIIDLSLSSYSGMVKSGLLEKLDGYGRIILDCEQVREGDVMIVVSNSGVNAAPVEVAAEAKKRGLSVVAITSIAHSKSVSPHNSLGKKLYEVADVTIDNCGVIGDALVKLGCLEQRVGPASTVTGAAVINAIVTQAVQSLIKKGVKPPVWVSGNVPGSEATNLAYMQKYKRTDRLP
jgi:uncharacterized phosphosugar-binding protein